MDVQAKAALIKNNIQQKLAYFSTQVPRISVHALASKPFRNSKPRQKKAAKNESEHFVIGNPKGLKHKAHMERDPRATWGITGLPKEWKAILQKSGITKEKILQDEQKALLAIKFVAEGQKNERIPLLSEQQLQKRKDDIGQIKQNNPEKRYQKLDRVGGGASGEVFKVREKQTGKILAVKISPIEELEFIKNEIAYHALSDHRNIVNYLETFQWKRDVWIIMDFVEGGCLTDILGEDNPAEWTEPFIAYVMHECLQPLHFMHNLHLLHRDIKSDNVLVGRDGAVKLADFGFAVGLTHEKSHRKSTVGTPYWMAPEVIEGVEYDGRCDIWSLGITAIELVNHEPPHMDKSHVEALLDIMTLPPPIPDQADKCSGQFLDFLDRSLKKDAKNRATASELLEHDFLKKQSNQTQFSGFVEYVLDERDKMESESEIDD